MTASYALMEKQVPKPKGIKHRTVILHMGRRSESRVEANDDTAPVLKELSLVRMRSCATQNICQHMLSRRRDTWGQRPGGFKLDLEEWPRSYRQGLKGGG